jgi:hypothetical protein
MHGLTPPYSFSDGRNDVRVARAAAQIATHALANLWRREILNREWLRYVYRRGTRPARSRFFDHCDSRHDLARRAKTALKPVMLDEHLLERVQAAVALQPLNGGNLMAIVHRRQSHTGQNPPAFDVDCARPAFPAIARFLRAGQGQFITQCIEQSRPRLDF